VVQARRRGGRLVSADDRRGHREAVTSYRPTDSGSPPTLIHTCGASGIPSGIDAKSACRLPCTFPPHLAQLERRVPAPSDARMAERSRASSHRSTSAASCIEYPEQRNDSVNDPLPRMISARPFESAQPWRIAGRRGERDRRKPRTVTADPVRTPVQQPPPPARLPRRDGEVRARWCSPTPMKSTPISSARTACRRGRRTWRLRNAHAVRPRGRRRTYRARSVLSTEVGHERLNGIAIPAAAAG
jgi:hypothetical protein